MDCRAFGGVRSFAVRGKRQDEVALERLQSFDARMRERETHVKVNVNATAVHSFALHKAVA